MLDVIIFSVLAGITMLLGGIAARTIHFRSRWLDSEFKHGVVAFGGGALISAVALVLIPQGLEYASPANVIASFIAGGVVFFLVDRTIQRSGLKIAQLLAMILDYVPESIALGAVLAGKSTEGLLLALLIALQNFPEGFNAFREIKETGHYRANTIIAVLGALVLLGPAAAVTGYVFLFDDPEILGGLMCFASAGILYLMFQDIAPLAHYRRHWGPPLGAVAGFLAGLVGQMVLGS